MSDLIPLGLQFGEFVKDAPDDVRETAQQILEATRRIEAALKRIEGFTGYAAVPVPGVSAPPSDVARVREIIRRAGARAAARA